MATAGVISKNQGDPSEIAKQEKSAIDFVDSFLDSKISVHGANCDITLESLQAYVLASSSKEISKYIGTTIKQIRRFIAARVHLWTVGDATDKVTVIKKQSSELRSLLVSLVQYLQRRSRKDDWGAKLNEIGSMIGQFSPSIKRDMGKGMQKIKAFLSDYPLLFVMDPFDDEDVFVNRANVVDSVILLSSVYRAPSPVYLEGVGPVKWMCPQYGFIHDEFTGQDAYFRVEDVDGVNRRKIKKGQRYTFQAMLSVDYEEGKTENKWSVFHMEVASPSSTDGDSEDSPTTANSASASNANTPESSTASLQWSDENDFFLPSLKKELDEPWLVDISSRLIRLQDGLPEITPQAREICGAVSISATALSVSIGRESEEERVPEPPERVKEEVAKRNIGSQTEPVDDRELILRLLHRNPDLIDFAETYIRAVKH